MPLRCAAAFHRGAGRRPRAEVLALLPGLRGDSVWVPMCHQCARILRRDAARDGEVVPMVRCRGRLDGKMVEALLDAEAAASASGATEVLP